MVDFQDVSGGSKMWTVQGALLEPLKPDRKVLCVVILLVPVLQIELRDSCLWPLFCI